MHNANWIKLCLFIHFIMKYSRLPITRTLANSNQNRFPLDLCHTFTVILPSVTRNLDNSNSRKLEKSREKSRLLASETLNFRLPIDVL